MPLLPGRCIYMGTCKRQQKKTEGLFCHFLALSTEWLTFEFVCKQIFIRQERTYGVGSSRCDAHHRRRNGCRSFNCDSDQPHLGDQDTHANTASNFSRQVNALSRHIAYVAAKCRETEREILREPEVGRVLFLAI